MYDDQPETVETSLPGEERSHARILQNLVGDASTGMAGPALARFEGRHSAVGGNALRAAVLGANDGLASNLALVMGVAGASISNDAVLVAGFAGLLAGAISMALGEWLSIQSSRELYQRQLDIEKREIAEVPEEGAEELALIYQAKGMSAGQARTLAARIMEDEEAAAPPPTTASAARARQCCVPSSHSRRVSPAHFLGGGRARQRPSRGATR